MPHRDAGGGGRDYGRLRALDNATNETGFAVQRAVAPEGPWGYAGGVGPDRPWFTDEPPVGPSFWYYRVLALGAGACYSAPSNVVVASGQ